MKVVVAALTGTNGDPTADSSAANGALERAGRLALGVVVLAWVVILALLARHRIVVTHDSLINYAHAWWINSQLWHGHGIPWRMPVLGHGTALTFPYGALPWLVAALLWPLLGEWAVTLVLVVGVLGLIAATFWAFPEIRRPWWAVLVLTNPILVLAPLSGQLPFLWGSALLTLGIGWWRRDRRLWAVLAVGLAQLTHVAVVLPIAAILVLLRLRWEPHRRALLGCYLISVAIAAPAIWPVINSPVFTETSLATKVVAVHRDGPHPAGPVRAPGSRDGPGAPCGALVASRRSRPSPLPRTSRYSHRLMPATPGHHLGASRIRRWLAS